jgi:hypothetical protein
VSLLDLDLAAGRFDLLLDLFGFFLGRALADGLVGDRRPIIISLLPGDVIAFREYRRRQVFSLPIDYVFKCAVTSTARAAKSKPKR